MHAVRRTVVVASTRLPCAAAASVSHAAVAPAAAAAAPVRRSFGFFSKLRGGSSSSSSAEEEQQQAAASAAAASASSSSSSSSSADDIPPPFRRTPRPLPVIPHAELFGSVHRVRPPRMQVPAELTPEEQGSGATFIPTLMRPAEWIKPTQPTLPASLPWHPKARRTGLLGTKLGMMQLWDHHGVRTPITVVKIDSQVIGYKRTLSPRGLLGLQVGTGRAKFKNTSKRLMVHCAKTGVMPPRKIVEFQVTPDAMLPLAWRFNVRHFVPGQFLDVTGTSIGKGFQGGMKKWGFGGLNASHGVSVSHRSIGATGSRQDPGRVFKGKKMPGRMGGKRVTKQNNKLFKIDVKNNLLYIAGPLPGNKGNYLIIRDAVKKPWNPETPPPFPTYRPKAGDENVEEIVCAPAEADPFAFGVA